MGQKAKLVASPMGFLPVLMITNPNVPKQEYFMIPIDPFIHEIWREKCLNYEMFIQKLEIMRNNMRIVCYHFAVLRKSKLQDINLQF